MNNNYFPKISIVTTVYNGERYLEQTIQSVIEQDYPNIEYIIIDGGSKDKTVDIIKKYSDKISFWVSEPDKGIYDGMNKGVARATGEWILFRNCGDFFASTDSISKVFDGTDYSGEDILYGKLISWDSIGYRIIDKHLEDNIGFVGYMPIPHPSTFVKTAIHKRMPFDIKYKLAADHDFFWKCVKQGLKFKYIPVFVSLFEAEDGASRKYPYISMMEHYYIHGGSNRDFRSISILKLKVLKLRVKMKIKELIPCCSSRKNKEKLSKSYRFQWNDELSCKGFIERAISQKDIKY